MKALCWYGKEDVRIESVPEPKIMNPKDATVKITGREEERSRIIRAFHEEVSSSMIAAIFLI
jgi:hypothetical protein